MSTDDPFDLNRFVVAQSHTWPQAIAELVAGEKRSHWMWFIFPQFAGLGRSETARLYAIHSIAEAMAYLAHPLLGSRLFEATEAVLQHPSRGAERMLGPVDAVKLRSCLTMFIAAGADEPFGRALKILFGGRGDAMTLRLMAAGKA